jgi:hypothetical protein
MSQQALPGISSNDYFPQSHYHYPSISSTSCLAECKMIILIHLVPAIIDNYLIIFIPMLHINFDFNVFYALPDENLLH